MTLTMLLRLLPTVLATAVVASASSSAAAGAAASATPRGTLPPTAPNWPVSYDLASSTLTMACNGSGWSSPQRGAQFGVVSYDWSNRKAHWAMQTPMDCEAELVEQARKTKAANPATHAFVYRNIVKALPWFASVRAKLDDPAFAGWFLRFDPARRSNGTYHVPDCAPENASKCSVFYHDQEQTPEVAGGDGKCPDTGCDCGTQPCGEYLFDHRNASVRKFIIDELINGPKGMGDAAISGMFIDDYWCSDLICKEDPHVHGCPCGDPVQGPTEINKFSQQDMGLSDAEVKAITVEWNATMGLVQQAILDKQGYTWSLIEGQDNANASPHMVNNATCRAQLQAVCTAGASSPWQRNPQLFGITHQGLTMTQLQQDIAFFLLVRGKWAWIGWGTWGMTWPFNPEPAHGQLPPMPGGLPLPGSLSVDHGEPAALCHESAPGVFTRTWTKTTVELDCNTFAATFTPAH